MPQDTVIVVVRSGDTHFWFIESEGPFDNQYVIEACKRDPSLESVFLHYPDHRTFAELKRPLGLA